MKKILAKKQVVNLILIAATTKTLLLFIISPFAAVTAHDESGYAALIMNMSGKTLYELLFELTPVNYRAGSSFYLPAILLHKLGVAPILSIRIVSSIMGLLCIYVLFSLLRPIMKKHGTSMNFHRVSLMLTALYCFVPSHFYWSTVGLRESTVEFWTLLSFLLLYKVFEASKVKFYWFAGICVSIFCVFTSRPQIGWVQITTLIIVSVFRIRRKTGRILLLATLIGLLLGQLATSDFVTRTSQTLIATSRSESSEAEKNATSQSESSEAEKIAATRLCKTENQVVKVNEFQYTCTIETITQSLPSLKNPGRVIIAEAQSIPQRQKLNQEGAQSVIKTRFCPLEVHSSVDRVFCLMWNAPFTTYTFLFRPMLGADITSSSSLFAAIENIFWLAAFLFVVIMFVQNRRLAFFSSLAPSLIFFSIYAVGAGASEGNMGTAFRHKSLILWVVILLLGSTIVATQQRKAEQQGISGSSQE